MKGLSRKLRQNQTEAELKFWLAVRDRRFLGLKFRRQYQVEGFIVDFACLEKRLIVELDGGQHNDSENDHVRTAILEGNGFLVQRFWNNDVLNNMDGVLCALSETLNTLTPTLSLREMGSME